jgi:hypothetical protein
MCRGRQLQDGRVLACAQTREQHHLPIREFQCIVMDCRDVHVNLPEPRETLINFLGRENAEAENRIAFNVLVERNFGAGQQADRNIWLANSSKPRVMELRNLVVTSLSSILAGRVATKCRL